MDLPAALRRKDLDERHRLLLLAKAAIWPADWPSFAAVVAAAATRLPRSDLEETLLQATLFYGFPRTVTAFERLERAWPAPTPPTGGDVPEGERRSRGAALFAAIYGANDAAVRAMLHSFHASFHDFVIDAAYGRVLARPGLEPRTRELLAVTALAAQDQVPQLVAHARGALRFGAGRAEVREAIWCALRDEAAAEELLRRV